MFIVSVDAVDDASDKKEEAEVPEAPGSWSRERTRTRPGSCAFVRASRAAAAPEHSHCALRVAAFPRIPAPQGSWRRRGTSPFLPPDRYSRVATLSRCRARLWMVP